MIEQGTVDAKGTSAYIARPEGTPKGAVVVCFEIFGLNSHMEDLCHRFAEQGYVGAAPDFYHRNDGARVVPYSDRETAIELANTITDASVMSDIDSVFEYLKSQPAIDEARLGIVGYCMGGRLAFLAACRKPELKACVSFYGGGIATRSRFQGLTAIPLEEANSIATPMFLAYGGQDQSIPAEDIQATKDRLEKLGKNAEFQIYPDAGHGFLCDERESYNDEAAKDGWERTITFLNEHMA
jgi:carboxymethylenebutenolidase